MAHLDRFHSRRLLQAADHVALRGGGNRRRRSRRDRPASPIRRPNPANSPGPGPRSGGAERARCLRRHRARAGGEDRVLTLIPVLSIRATLAGVQDITGPLHRGPGHEHCAAPPLPSLDPDGVLRPADPKQSRARTRTGRASSRPVLGLHGRHRRIRLQPQVDEGMTCSPSRRGRQRGLFPEELDHHWRLAEAPGGSVKKTGSPRASASGGIRR